MRITKAALLASGILVAAGIGTMSFAASPNRNVPSNQGIDNAAAHAAIDLRNTIASDAGAGNGPETTSATTVSVATTTEVIPTSTISTQESSSSVTGTPVLASVTDATYVAPDGHSSNFKIQSDNTYNTDTTTTTTTTTTTDSFETTNTLETTTTTTDYTEHDPGRSAAVNQSPEEPAPPSTEVVSDPVVVATIGPVLVDTDVATTTDVAVDTVVTTTVDEQTNCNPGNTYCAAYQPIVGGP